MKKWMLTLVLALLAAWAAAGQTCSVVVDPAVPEEAAEVLRQRFSQMLEAGGLTVVADGDVPTLWVQAVRTDRMEMPGDRKQVAVVLEVTARMESVAGGNEEVTGTFTVKGVGDDDADAWLRAVKQILPRSKAAQAFVKQLL